MTPEQKLREALIDLRGNRSWPGAGLAELDRVVAAVGRLLEPIPDDLAIRRVEVLAQRRYRDWVISGLIGGDE